MQHKQKTHSELFPLLEGHRARLLKMAAEELRKKLEGQGEIEMLLQKQDWLDKLKEVSCELQLKI